MDIEEVAAKTPEKIHKVAIDPAAGLTDQDAEDDRAQDRRAATTRCRRRAIF